MVRKGSCFLLLELTLTLLSSCQPPSASHPDHTAVEAPDVPASAYQKRYVVIMERMHRDMASVQLDTNDMISYLRQMIPHHQGAIDMSEAILEHATDPRVINLAKGIITEQTNEIRLMNTLIQELEQPHAATQHPTIH